MNVTTKIKMNLRQPDITLGIDTVQGDCCSRSLEITLYSGVAPWTIPDGITVAVRYSKPDGTKGYYDTLPNGRSAWSIHDNLLTVELAPQMLTVAGTVLTQIEMIQGVKILSTFGLKIRVEANPAAGCMRSEDYVNWLQWIKDESEEHVRLIRQSQQAASQAVESAVAAAESANAFASRAEDVAVDAKSAAASAASSRAEAAAIAADVSAIVAGNEAYTKQESDSRYGAAIVETASGAAIALSDSAQAPLCGLRLFGKTTQAGIPSPENPVPLVNAGNSGSIAVTVSGGDLKQTLTISTPNGLPGIPVSSGGNYTDENGQQWICDEVDFARGRYIKWVAGGRIPIDSNVALSLLSKTVRVQIVLPDTWGTANAYTYGNKNGFFSHEPFYSAFSEDYVHAYVASEKIYLFLPVSVGTTSAEIKDYLKKQAENGTPLAVQYVLAAPIESKIPEDALAAYAALHTGKLSTTIVSDAELGMKLNYIADTTAYIDQKIAALSAAATVS